MYNLTIKKQENQELLYETQKSNLSHIQNTINVWKDHFGKKNLKYQVHLICTDSSLKFVSTEIY